MHLAVINEQTNIVENIIVPPSGTQAWFVPNGYYAILTDVGLIGWSYDKVNEVFIEPEETE